MNNEIKENLSELLFNRDERLLDYITNLQQENERLNNMLNNADNKNLSLIEEINDKQDIIGKAIEFIKEKARNNCWIDQYEASDLLNILQNGSDDNE